MGIVNRIAVHIHRLRDHPAVARGKIGITATWTPGGDRLESGFRTALVRHFPDIGSGIKLDAQVGFSFGRVIAAGQTRRADRTRLARHQLNAVENENVFTCITGNAAALALPFDDIKSGKTPSLAKPPLISCRQFGSAA